MKYKLKEPIQFGEETITELNIREKIVAGDMRGITIKDEMLHDDVIKLVGRLSGRADPIINKMALADYIEVAALLETFMQAGPATGNEASSQ